MTDSRKEELMRRALELAKKGWGMVHPDNPMVGALIVEKNEVVGEGWYEKDGGAHAEVNALKNLGRRPKKGATLICTLEPCSTKGRTGACVDAILQSGIRHVILGAIDPNPAHAGRGLEKLKENNVSVETRVLTDECEDLNLLYNHWKEKNTPFFAAKTATTIDGYVATRSGQSKWITGEEARLDVMRWRRFFPAIAVGAGTVTADNPKLTSRLPKEKEWCPIRFVFDGLLTTAMEKDHLSVYSDKFKSRTIVVTSNHAGSGYVQKLEDDGVRVWVLPSVTPQISFETFRERCVQEKITGVYFEGGPRLIAGIMREKGLDYLFSYRAPIIFADEKGKNAYSGLKTDQLDQAIRLERVKHQALGDDQLIRGFTSYPAEMNFDEYLLGIR